MAWQAATRRVDITPPVGTPMGGYGIALGAPPRTATGTFSPLTARALALWDGAGAHVIVSADILGWSTAAATTVRQRVTAATGLAPEHLLLVATHSHNTAALPGVLDPYMTYGITDTTAMTAYETQLVNAVVQLITGVLGSTRQAVTVDFKTVSASFSANREGLGYIETAVPVLVARRTNGQPLAVAFGYGTHPVCAGIQTLWDGDYPSAAAGAIEGVFPGSTALFLPGACGDQDPTGDRGWAARATRGIQLASAVVTAAATAGRTLTGVAAARSTTVSLPLDVTIVPANLQAVRSAYEARIAAAGDGWHVRHAQRMVQLIDSGAPIPTVVPTPLQTWRFAATTPLRLAFAGGEPVSGYAVYFRQRYGGAGGVWLGGFGHGDMAYLPSDELLPPLRTGGSYAGGWDTDFPGIAGGSQCVYGWIGHFLAGANGVESSLINGLTSMLDA